MDKQAEIIFRSKELSTIKVWQLSSLDSQPLFAGKGARAPKPGTVGEVVGGGGQNLSLRLFRELSSAAEKTFKS